MGQQEHHAIQQGRMPSRTPGKEDALQWHSLAMSLLGSSSLEKTLGIRADSKLQVRQQHALAVKMANSILGCMNSSIARRSLKRIIPLISPHPDTASSFGALTQYRKGIDKLECVQGGATEMVGSWSTCPFRRG